jgi:hypothetical protein
MMKTVSPRRPTPPPIPPKARASSSPLDPADIPTPPPVPTKTAAASRDLSDVPTPPPEEDWEAAIARAKRAVANVPRGRH